MRYVSVAGTSVSVIGLGTWQFGSREWRYGSDYANREAIALTRRALDLGINLIDTAEIYGLGRSERIVGAAIADRRDQVFLATKLFPALPLSPVVRQRGRASARRLGVRWIDLYQLHAPNPVIPLSRAMRGFADLARGRSHPRRRRQQLLARAVAGGGGGAGRHRAVEPGSLQPRHACARAGDPALGAGQRPSRDRLQPAGAGAVVGSVRPCTTDHATCDGETRCSCPTTCGGPGLWWNASARWRPGTEPRRRKWHWRGWCAVRTWS